MLFASANYAIGQAHYRISGGTRTLLLAAAGYVAIAASLLGIFFYNVEWPPPSRAIVAIYTLAFVVEAFLLVVAGSIRVSGCIRTDVSTNMIESHRLMPVAAWRAMAGYLLGSTTHVMAITALNVGLLANLAPWGGISFDSVVIGQVVLAAFALFVWSFSAMGSMIIKQMMPLIILGFVLGGFMTVVMRESGLLPGFSVLASPFLGETIFNVLGLSSASRAAYALAFAAQGGFAALFFVGACRRYRGTYPSTFNVPLALALGLVWGLLSIVAIRNWDAFSPPLRWTNGRADVAGQVLASVTVAALLAIIPVHALWAWSKRHANSAIFTLLTLVGTTVVNTMIVAASPYNARLWGVTLLVIGAHALTVHMGLRLVRRMSPMAVIVTMSAILFTVWILPLIIQVVHLIIDLEARGSLGIIGTLSPLGLLISEWSIPRPPSPMVGLIYQWMVPAGLWWLGSVMEKKRRHVKLAAETAGKVAR